MGVACQTLDHAHQSSLPSLPQGVWSDEDACISLLSNAVDQLSQPTNTLERILDRVASLLEESAEGGMASEEEEEEEEDEEFEDYYDDDQDMEQEEVVVKPRFDPLPFPCTIAL